jgi:hypothetical protein
MSNAAKAIQDGAGTTLFRTTCVVLSIVILFAITLGGSVLSVTSRYGPKLFVNWFRHLTNWNAIICSLWLLVAASSKVSNPNETLIGFGYFVVLLNLFVTFVRWGWFRISNVRSQPAMFFSDVIVHALIPAVTCVSVFMVCHHENADWMTHRRAVVWGIVSFWVLIILWYAINMILKKFKIVSWPYPNGAGKSLPRDIYQGDSSTRAFWFYMANNFVQALALSGIVAFYAFARSQ